MQPSDPIPELCDHLNLRQTILVYLKSYLTISLPGYRSSGPLLSVKNFETALYCDYSVHFRIFFHALDRQYCLKQLVDCICSCFLVL